MQQLFPRSDAPDSFLDARSAVADQPVMARWVYTNMVTSVDGAATIDGKSGALGGPADLAMFRALRAASDVILVGAGTVRDEKYRLPRAPDPHLAGLRRNRINTAPVLCVVTRSLDLADDLPFLVEAASNLEAGGTPSPPTMVATCGEPDPSVLARLGARCEVISFGRDTVDLAKVVEHLATVGLGRILCEGGPTLLGQLADLDLVDEWNFTVSPQVVGGRAGRPMSSPHQNLRRLQLHQLLVADDSTLFARYLRPTSADHG